MCNQTHGFMENDFLKWFEAKTSTALIRVFPSVLSPKNSIRLMLLCSKEAMVNELVRMECGNITRPNLI